MIVKNVGICTVLDCTVVEQERVECVDRNCTDRGTGKHYHCQGCHSLLITDEEGEVQKAEAKYGLIQCTRCKWQGHLSELETTLLNDRFAQTAILLCTCPNFCDYILFTILFRKGKLIGVTTTQHTVFLENPNLLEE